MRWCVAVAAAVLLVGCAQTGPRSATGAEVTDVMAVFRAGELRLTCDTSCSGAWGAHRREAKGYYNARLWPDLVNVIAQVGMRVDSGYFYLARAAEGLRYTEAARTYYRLALATTFKCAGVFNNCDGIDVPREASAGLSRLAQAPAEPAAGRRSDDGPLRVNRPKEEPVLRP
ncbi:MAG: hypothetical protein RL522_1983 [Pseudomonadota bacterium]|jgi:hypothetical protein